MSGLVGPGGAPGTPPLAHAALLRAHATLVTRWPGLRIDVAVVRDGAVSTASTEPGPAARFLVYSVTKPILAALVLEQAGAGALDLDAPVSALLPDCPFEGTPRQLLRHTAGLGDYGGVPEYHAAVRATPGAPWRFDTLLADAIARPRFAPDGGWAYSNLGYHLLLRLVERAGPFAEQVARLAAEHGLHDLAVAARPADLRPLAAGWSREIAPHGAAPIDVRGRYHPGWVAHGVVSATAADIGRLVHGLVTGAVLGPRATGALRTHVPVSGAHPRFVAPSYALGLMCDPAARRGPTFGHTGAGPGYAAAVFTANPDTNGVTVAVLANAEVSDAVEALVLELLDAAV